MRTMSRVDTARFRQACSQFATGVTAVTAAGPGGEVAALAVNSFTSVSLEPAQVLVCIGTATSSYPIVSAAERLAVHVLAAEQGGLARRLATSGLTGEERLAGVPWRPGEGGEPLIPGAAACLAGPVVRRVRSGDHLILIVEIDHVETDGTEPGVLAYHRGAFSVIPALNGAEGAER